MIEISFTLPELLEAFNSNTIKELIESKIFGYRNNQEFFEKLSGGVLIKVSEYINLLKTMPESKPDWASKLVVQIEPPKPAVIGSCSWEGGISV